MTWPHQESLFLYECDTNEDFGVKMSQKYDQISMICQTAKTLLQAQNTQDYKRFFTLFFFLYHAPIIAMLIQNLQKQVGSLKIDKRDKLLKVNILSDAEWLFGVTPKETCSENNVILHKKSDLRTTKQSKNGIIPLA